MKVDSDWTATVLIPENENEERILNELWNVLPEGNKAFLPCPGAAVFIRRDKDDKELVISTGE